MGGGVVRKKALGLYAGRGVGYRAVRAGIPELAIPSLCGPAYDDSAGNRARAGYAVNIAEWRCQTCIGPFRGTL